ncbi:hypothetical protein [Methylobacterium sp. GC_Met_2]|uniref:hypothetical protein n=1 Tax=Methylobacterium sp. GC_Met_2 TaxID=2937376 RepID=UPI00226BB54F|nr:hypothetical protein [Methylobacterium sp. GC_Met_2]
MLTRDPHPSFLDPADFGAPWRRLGVTGRTGQTLEITWTISIKQGLDDRAAPARTRAATRDPAEILAAQSAYPERGGARRTARSAVTADQITTPTADPMRPPAPHPTRAHERVGGRAPVASSAGRTSARRRLAKSAHRL